MTDPSTVYDRLRTQILELERLPGSRVTERGLEAELGASRTPLRAALQRLEAEGLIAHEGRGWQVSPIDLGEIGRLSELRDALETAAVRHTCARAGDDAITAIARTLDTQQSAHGHDAAVRAGEDFHVRLAALSGNHFFADAVQSAMTRLARTRWLEVRTEETRRAAWEEHRAIVELVGRRDADAAAERIHAHIVATHDRLLAALDADARGLRARGLAIVR
ncbi:GntR family transcriptional regulator [Leifsonia sp. F6_8S_P_1B]|uniref:GntR family transcriptional regulator n=1 Tax=Leifsonia williamsii TaxID=3035919 RepID=A0ABT8KDD9_9MICO|nr:GntR family transcriptional regulator [Leifsonia williamsii]MDN4615022.1 GntR family transcriptional regulator [Leifsonia williamsii]